MSGRRIDQTSSVAESSPGLSRREFFARLGGLGGGILITASLGPVTSEARMPRRGFLAARLPSDFNAFLRIAADNKVTCFVGKIEMGQGVITSLPQMMADELDVAYDAVGLVMGDTDLCPWDAGTFGSLSTRYFGVFLREAAAEAKGVLKELAAKKLKVPLARLATRNGHVFDRTRPTVRVAYGQLTQGKVIQRHLKKLPPLKPLNELTEMGRSRLSRDARAKVTGRAKFAGDIRLPGMLYAALLRPPAHGARLKSVDLSAAKAMAGVRVVQDKDLVACLHEKPDLAIKARDAIKAEFTPVKTGVNDKNIYAHLLKSAPRPQVTGHGGSLAAGRAKAAQVVERIYRNAYVAHAPIECHTAVAKSQGGRITIWASTQRPFGLQDEAAAALHLPAKKIRVITPFVGGAFGGKNANQQGVEAARLAKLTGRPIQVAWSRAEEFFYDTYRPAAVVKIKAGLDKSGRICFWNFTTYYAGQRGSELFYDVPNHRTAVSGAWRGAGSDVHPFAVGPWRAPANNTNTYARELHMNLLAQRAGADPLAFRLRHLKDKRMRGVLTAAAGKFGWKPGKPPSGQGQGIACGIDAGAYVATMAQAKVDRASGRVKVDRVVCAQDMGYVVDPHGATLQVEGCVTMGLGYALGEEMHFSNGKLKDLNFDSYEITHFSWLPKIETVLVPNKGLQPQGGGEPAIINMGGVVATAIHDATGKELLQLPMTPARVKGAK